MAIIGDKLPQPESGWRRYDQNYSMIGYTGTWSIETLDANYGGTASYTSTSGATASFSFYGTKLRVIGGTYSGRTTTAQVIVDGVVKGTINENSIANTNILVFEVTGLTRGTHSVQIKTVDTATLLIDAFDIDEDGWMVGTLSTPDAGWKRYDDTSPVFKYTGTGWASAASNKYTSDTTASVMFSFIGTKIRFIHRTYSNHRTVVMTIDGVSETYAPQQYGDKTQMMIYEKTGLSNKRHDVVMTFVNDNTYSNNFDAVDIESDGRMIHTDEVLDVKDLVVGKKIRCHYRASVAGQVGLITDIGKEVSDFIPAASSATPDGDFYFNMVDEVNGKKYCIPDRNIQHSIPWDTLNSAGLINGLSLDGKYSSTSSPKNYLVIDDKFAYRIVGDVTVNAKVKIPSITGGLFVQYSAYGETNANNVLYSLGVYDTGVVYFGHEYGAGNNEFVFSTYKMPLNEVVDLTVTRDATNKKYDLYVNGVFHSSYTYTNNPTFTDPSTHKLYLGGDATSSGTPGLNVTFYNVTIDDKYVNKSDFTNYNKTKYANDKLFSLNMLANNDSAKYTLRLLTGGTTSTDKDNDWDKYIVNRTGNGAYQAGDNNVWNWNGVLSWTSTTPTTNTERVRRGQGSVTGYNTFASSQSTTTVGFRPMLIIELTPITKTLIYTGGAYKNYKDNLWNTVSTTLPDENTFKNEGNDVADFTRRLKVFKQTLNGATTLGSGKQFKTKVDLKRYIDLIKLELK